MRVGKSQHDAINRHVMDVIYSVNNVYTPNATIYMCKSIRQR